MSTDYWSYALLIAIFLINLLPTSVLSFVSPWSKLYSSPPDLPQLKVFGCACYPLLRPYSSHKLDPRTKECLFLGYSPRSKGFLCLDVSSQHIYTSRHVLFNESKFPFTTLSSFISTSPSPVPNLSNALWLSNLLYLHDSNHPSLLGPYSSHTNSSPHVTSLPHSSSVDRPPTSTDHTLPTSSCPIDHAPVSNPSSLPTTSTSLVPHTSPPLIDSTLSTIPVSNQHPMQTRSKSAIIKPNFRLCYKAILDYNFIEPPSYKVASKYPVWCEAMDAKFQALQRQQTWTLVLAPPYANLVGCKWVFKIKLHSDRFIARYKARLVAKGFHQQAGIDY